MKWGAEVCPSGVPGVHWPSSWVVCVVTGAYLVLCKGSLIWNEVPTDIQNKVSVKHFTYSLKLTTLGGYNYSIEHYIVT